MPIRKGVDKKGKKFYGAKWRQGRTYVTKLCDTAEEAAGLRELLIKELQKGVEINKRSVTVE